MSKITGLWKRHLRPVVLNTLWQRRGMPTPTVARLAHDHARSSPACRLIELPATGLDIVAPRPIVGDLDAIEQTKAMIPDPVIRAAYEHRLRGTSEQRCDEFVVVLDGGRVCHDSGLVITPENHVLTDTSRIAPDSDLPTSPLRLRYLPPPRRVTGCLATLSCVMPYNYYHWLLEAIPRIALYERAGVPIDRFYAPVRYAFQRDLLALAGISRDRIIPATTTSHVVADRLAASSLRLNATQWKVDFLFDRFTSSLTAAAPGQRVYVSRRRRGKRTLVNDAAVFAALRPLGFRRYQLESLTAAEQIRLFLSAECVVGPHGAGLTNLAFCRPGTKVVEINTPYRTTTCFSDIAFHRGLDYRLHVAAPVHDGFAKFLPHEGIGDANMTVDPRAFAAGVAEFLTAPGARPCNTGC